jgi:hypothetical protein
MNCGRKLLAQRRYLVLGTILLFASGAAEARNTTPGVDTNAQLDSLATALENGAVATIDILHMPDAVETRVSVTPELLEKWFRSRLSINRVSEWAGRAELIKIMKSGTITGLSRMPDLRSAVIFYGGDGRRIGALYLGRYFGRHVGLFSGADGAIEGTPVSLKGDLPTWFKEMIPSSLQ